MVCLVSLYVMYNVAFQHAGRTRHQLNIIRTADDDVLLITIERILLN